MIRGKGIAFYKFLCDSGATCNVISFNTLKNGLNVTNTD